jgi:3-oxoacyl-[acyl-carrier protein] reductase
MAARDVVVSGGGTGIGRAIAAMFAADGDRVFILGRRREVLEQTAKELGPGVEAVACDLADPGSVQAMVDQLPQRVDVVVNNAGSRDFADHGDGLEGIAIRWRSDFSRNVLTAVMLTEAVKSRVTRPGGRIVTVSSIVALRGSGPVNWSGTGPSVSRGNGSFAAAKAALLAWNHTLALEVSGEGITANVVLPGLVGNTDFFGGTFDEEELRRRGQQTLVGRVGLPEDVAAAVHFLASPQASFVTGEFLNCNGGALLGR